MKVGLGVDMLRLPVARCSCRGKSHDMSRVPRYARILLFFCTGSTLLCGLLILHPDFLGTRDGNGINDDGKKRGRAHWSPPMELRKRNFTDEEINKMSLLGRWLLATERRAASPPIAKDRKEPFLILIWKHGPFLERRHIRRFTNKKFLPWDNCTVKNCVLSYRAEDLDVAAAVVFHLHLTKSPLEIPRRTRRNQRWIFLTDESPINTFLHGDQKLRDYNGLFNWSMSYRTDSDIPVPYGRTILKDFSSSESVDELISSQKTKLVAIMGSNCAGNNGRWRYVNELKSYLGDELDVFGRCLNGNVTACPGHFDRDCSALNAYKFYLAFENSNCEEYITEKVYWHGYHKLAVPIIMGAPRNDCERLLPPKSFMHIEDFANPTSLATYLKYLDRHVEEYIKYHAWRQYYSVIDEHGYFGSSSVHYCRICEALHYNSPVEKVYQDLESWRKKRDCVAKRVLR
ncbi:hypothetical protein KM043_018698 [Ampulex compressa]|nr:hypothetical protein KM043_018698 [Ampulex compressa]